MLMKKILSLLLILAMLTVAMVSCKKDEPTQDPTPPAQETRYTITAEEWAAVLTLKNYTAEITNSQTQILNGGEPEVESSTGLTKSTDTVCYEEQRDGDDVYKTYIVVGLFNEEFGCFFIEMIRLHPAKQRSSAHWTKNDTVFDFHIPHLPRCK